MNSINNQELDNNMLLHLTEFSNLPMHEQIVDQIVYRIAHGEMEGGVALESSASLSKSHRLNKRTVEAAYRMLHDKGLVSSDGHIVHLSERQKTAIRKHCDLMDAIKAGNYVEAVEKYQFEEELHTARQLQQELVSGQLPVHGSFVFAGKSKPCRELGGDLYEVLPLDRDHTAVFIADVSGHGISSAILGAQIQALLRSNLEMQPDLIKVISDLNNYIHRHQPSKKFATLFVGILNTQTGSMEYINAGQNNPFLLKKDGSADQVKTTGPALGLIPDVDFECGKIIISKEEMLILYTDGITEVMNREEQEYGEQCFLKCLTDHKDYSPGKILTNIFSDVMNFAGTPLHEDDQTMLIIKHK